MKRKILIGFLAGFGMALSATAAEGPQTLKLALAKTGVNAFRFTYEPGTADIGAALLGALDYSTGCMLIIR